MVLSFSIGLSASESLSVENRYDKFRDDLLRFCSANQDRLETQEDSMIINSCNSCDNPEKFEYTFGSLDKMEFKLNESSCKQDNKLYGNSEKLEDLRKIDCRCILFETNPEYYKTICSKNGKTTYLKSPPFLTLSDFQKNLKRENSYKKESINKIVKSFISTI